jgi:hypothetical protein
VLCCPILPRLVLPQLGSFSSGDDLVLLLATTGAGLSLGSGFAFLTGVGVACCFRAAAALFPEEAEEGGGHAH